jgi:hypothetical protein
MREEIEKVLCGDLEEERVNQICEVIKNKLEWLRRRLQGDSLTTGNDEELVSMEYVDARIDDLEVYLTKN